MITSNKDFCVTANNCETPLIEVTIQNLDLTTAMTMATELILAYRCVEVQDVITGEVVYRPKSTGANVLRYSETTSTLSVLSPLPKKTSPTYINAKSLSYSIDTSFLCRSTQLPTTAFYLLSKMQ